MKISLIIFAFAVVTAWTSEEIRQKEAQIVEDPGYWKHGCGFKQKCRNVLKCLPKPKIIYVRRKYCNTKCVYPKKYDYYWKGGCKKVKVSACVIVCEFCEFESLCTWMPIRY